MLRDCVHTTFPVTIQKTKVAEPVSLLQASESTKKVSRLFLMSSDVDLPQNSHSDVSKTFRLDGSAT